MKRAFFFLIVLLPSLCFSQNSIDFDYLFFGRLSSARLESMGRGFNGATSEISNIYFNPAASSSVNGIVLETSFASPFYLLDKAKYQYTGIGYRYKNLLSIGIARNEYSTGEYLYSYGSGVLYRFKPKITNYTLNLSFEPVKDFSVGLNTNCLVFNHIPFLERSRFYFDIGVLKKIVIAQNSNSLQELSFGASLINFTKLKIKNDMVDSEVPFITRYSVNYNCQNNSELLIDSLKTFSITLSAEYKDVLNSFYYNGFHFGGELTISEIIFLRGGYYTQKENDMGFPLYNKDRISAYTYGFGIQLPIAKLTRFPLLINFDYTSLPQVSSARNYEWDDFKTINFRLNWVIR